MICYHARVSVTVSVSVDLDALACYHRIHALAEPVPEGARFAVLRRCLPRFGALFRKHGVKATFFVVGQDLEEDEEGRSLLRGLAAEGHELASHSHTHPYDLVRLSAAQIAAELDRAHAVIAQTAGQAPVGFRAPGYEVTRTVLTLLAERGYRYDSSVFPSVPYYAAKALVMGGMRVLGRPSGSILGSPRVLRAPTLPYRPAAENPYARGQLDLVELPVSVTPVLRLPVIGTALVTAPAVLRRALVASALSRDFFNFELHGIDLCDATGDGLASALVNKQPDLRVSLVRKLDALDATLEACQTARARFVPLREVAAEVSGRL